ncbi:MAG: hypothetical protein HYT73_01845 [Candidatus Aenigmarchaeota archaeon]|nr:hypothetical protein [Candidatus Aenigmarchaeota archaeon]
MEIEFNSNIRIANKKGTGFIGLPAEICVKFNIHDNLEIFLNTHKFFAQIIKFGIIGFYVPKVIAKNYLGNNVHIKIRKIDEIYSKVGYDGRIYIPIQIAYNMRLKDKDIILIKILETNNKTKIKYSEINVRKRGEKIEYMCMVDKDLAKSQIRFLIEKKKMNTNKAVYIINFSKIPKSNFAVIGNNIILFNRKMPIIINPNVKLNEIALYLGAYYSDGTKKGNNWAISASTIQQAKFYLEMHNNLIKENKIKFIISYTNIRNENKDEVIDFLRNYWIRNMGDFSYKFRIIKPTGKIFLKHNKFGTLVMREHRISLLDFYKILLEEILIKIKNGNKKLAIDFLCGILEGDGCVSMRGYLLIATNKNEYHSIEDVLKILKIKSKTVWENPDRVFIRIGILEILRNFDLLKDKIFMYYPKRRKMLFERLQTAGVVKFLIKRSHEPTGWVKSWMRENSFVDNQYNLTNKGIKLRKDLIHCIKTL